MFTNNGGKGRSLTIVNLFLILVKITSTKVGKPLTKVLNLGIIALLGFSVNSQAALSATSANTIQGSRPGFMGQSGAKKLGFKIGNAKYSESLGNLSATNNNLFDAGLTPGDFQITSLTAADFTIANDYQDVDGDGAATTPFTMNAMTHTWKDSANRTLTTADMSKMIGCGSGFSLPLTLTITIPNVQVHSKYGDPKDSDPAVLEQNYKITTTQGICYARPGSLEWYSYTGGATRSPTQGGGYTADFDPANGFKANPTVSNVKFPTTAFPKARFQLVMTGSQTDYNYNVITNPNSSATVDTSGWVTINNKPTGPITVRVTSKSSSSTYFDYTFNPTSLWVVPTGSSDTGNYAWAKNKCGVESKIPSREQLTNSPQSRVGQGVSIPSNVYTRAIGKLDIGGGAQPMKESIFSEWGWTSSDSSRYPGSQWYSS
ncbi:hypothetical protein RCS94_04250 [Orbaceae bacterium ac157xtp]